jgi:hypothetical protein
MLYIAERDASIPEIPEINIRFKSLKLRGTRIKDQYMNSKLYLAWGRIGERHLSADGVEVVAAPVQTLVHDLEPVDLGALVGGHCVQAQEPGGTYLLGPLDQTKIGKSTTDLRCPRGFSPQVT